MAAGLLPLFLLTRLPVHGERERSLVFFGVVLWMVVVAVATVRVLKRYSPAGTAAVASPSSRLEHMLNWTGVFLSFVVLYAAVVTRRPIPLWLWLCGVAIGAVITVMTVRSLPRGQRGRVANSVYGMIVAFSVLFPVMTVPRHFRGVASLLVTIVILATLVLMVSAAARQRKASAADAPRGIG